jgi:ribosomal protein S18 acetylase RimI-like enzyme
MNASTDALAAIRRSSQVYYAQIAEQTTLSCGVALTCPRYPKYPFGNQLREVLIPRGQSPAGCSEEVQAFYAGQGLRCLVWSPAAIQPVEPIEAFLTARGYTPIRSLALWWARDVEIPLTPNVRVLPARAMRRALREMIVSSKPGNEGVADRALERLDDPQYDLSLAMLGNSPVGHAALYQVGDIGRIVNVFIAREHRRQGVALSLMAHLLALARRLALRITCLDTEESNLPARALYARCGFEEEGSFVEYIAPEAIEEGLFRPSIEQ